MSAEIINGGNGRGRPKTLGGDTETISVRVPSDVYDVLCSSATATNKTLANLVRGVLEKYARKSKTFLMTRTTKADRMPRKFPSRIE